MHLKKLTEIAQSSRANERQAVQDLVQNLDTNLYSASKTTAFSKSLISEIRKNGKEQQGFDSFLNEYSLSSEEGLALMCLAEALLRIPDKKTVDKLIKDKLGDANWHQNLGLNQSFTVNAASFGLAITGKLFKTEDTQNWLTHTLKKIVTKTSEPIVRIAVTKAMLMLSDQFVLGFDMDLALDKSKTSEAKGYGYSYDMLGEAAITYKDADKYYDSYSNAIASIAKISHEYEKGQLRPGISVKLSALHPRYIYTQKSLLKKELLPKVIQLARQAEKANIDFTIDAEEADKLELALNIMTQLMDTFKESLWDGLGLAVQAYQKNALQVLSYLKEICQVHHTRLQVRLVKGAYWDSEIKQSQMLGIDYPVYTKKASTDLSYLVCAQFLLKNRDVFYPQFATHNAHTVSAILMMCDKTDTYEFQCLHGMGQSLYDNLMTLSNNKIGCRIYAPVGNQEDLLPYLVRRLLENGANSSFVNQILDKNISVDELSEDPLQSVKSYEKDGYAHPKIPHPDDMLLPIRQNAKGLDLSNIRVHDEIIDYLKQKDKLIEAFPIVGGNNITTGTKRPVVSPQDNEFIVGHITDSDEVLISEAYRISRTAHKAWQDMGFEKRAEILDNIAGSLTSNMMPLLKLLVNEAGKTIPDSISEIREAIDFCRYYASIARTELKGPKELLGYTGETNELSLHSRGTMVCISPWNFPAAIFTGQVVAALVTGNCVIAKPAEQTPLVAFEIVKLMHQAGIPKDVLHYLPGDGTVGAHSVSHPDCSGVLFTGSTDTARSISRALAQKEGPLVPLIAETGGLNAMIVDSSALTEQVVEDVIASAFGSAGQRCSALRVLFLQSDIADTTIERISGALETLNIDMPNLLETDIGPIIDNDALEVLNQHVIHLHENATFIGQGTLQNKCDKGSFLPPMLFEIKSLTALKKEVFGPILHVVRFDRKALDDILQQINRSGYGLTLGIHSRIGRFVDEIFQKIHVGNVYINRNMVGAVVGVQPFGGEGLSGTGPKAGGPHYLQRLCTERVKTTNTTAAGGNATLMSLNHS